MTQLKDKLAEKIQAHRPRTAKLTKEYADVVIDTVDIGQCIGGARDVKCLVTDISYLDAHEGIRFRGKTIPETFAALPKVAGSQYPTVESFWYFILTGEVPTQAQVDEIVRLKTNDLNARDAEHARRMIEGTARSMGVDVEIKLG